MGAFDVLAPPNPEYRNVVSGIDVPSLLVIGDSPVVTLEMATVASGLRFKRSSTTSWLNAAHRTTPRLCGLGSLSLSLSLSTVGAPKQATGANRCSVGHSQAELGWLACETEPRTVEAWRSHEPFRLIRHDRPLRGNAQEAGIALTVTVLVVEAGDRVAPRGDRGEATKRLRALDWAPVSLACGAGVFRKAFFRVKQSAAGPSVVVSQANDPNRQYAPWAGVGLRVRGAERNDTREPSKDLQ
jgi:hypothetical protein